MVTHAKLAHEFTYGGATVNIFHANKGEGIPNHAHEYSHATTCMTGSCKYTQDGKQLIANKDTKPINLIAGKHHEIEALEDGTIFMNVFETGKK
jgi:quercetin dioxygenase-like cupin family protein